VRDRFSDMGRSDKGIDADGLVRRFKDVEAVAGIDLTVAPGEIYGFLGPNGAGKSTTVHMLTTLLPPTAGRATVAGFDVARQGPQVRASIGAALDLPAVIRALDTDDVRAAEINLHQPTLDDVFLAKTGHTLEGAEAE
jgi:ABC-type multidrug transport system ATPase subunit